ISSSISSSSSTSKKNLSTNAASGSFVTPFPGTSHYTLPSGMVSLASTSSSRSSSTARSKYTINSNAGISPKSNINSNKLSDLVSFKKRQMIEREQSKRSDERKHLNQLQEEEKKKKRLAREEERKRKEKVRLQSLEEKKQQRESLRIEREKSKREIAEMKMNEIRRRAAAVKSQRFMQSANDKAKSNSDKERRMEELQSLQDTLRISVAGIGIGADKDKRDGSFKKKREKGKKEVYSLFEESSSSSGSDGSKYRSVEKKVKVEGDTGDEKYGVVSHIAHYPQPILEEGKDSGERYFKESEQKKKKTPRKSSGLIGIKSEKGIGNGMRSQDVRRQSSSSSSKKTYMGQGRRVRETDLSRQRREQALKKRLELEKRRK
ncbi:hypothetical protein ADUPG1_008826, partial [Aduncisulcus paluster]